MAGPRTLTRVAAITATLHDGTHMIVLKEDEKVTFAESSLAYLEGRNALREEGAKAEERAPQTAEPAESDDVFEVPEGYAVTEKGGGWYEITGPEGFEPVSARGADGVREKLAVLGDGGEADDEAPAT